MSKNQIIRWYLDFIFQVGLHGVQIFFLHFAALAIGLHNFPEGMATFVAALSDPSLGISLAVAIALHNVPEGLCVAMPVYYATGSRWKGFFWAFLSGVSEPIGKHLDGSEILDNLILIGKHT